MCRRNVSPAQRSPATPASSGAAIGSSSGASKASVSAHSNAANCSDVHGDESVASQTRQAEAVINHVQIALFGYLGARVGVHPPVVMVVGGGKIDECFVTVVDRG